MLGKLILAHLLLLILVLIFVHFLVGAFRDSWNLHVVSCFVGLKNFRFNFLVFIHKRWTLASEFVKQGGREGFQNDGRQQGG